MTQAGVKENRLRRSYSRQFKAEVVAQCVGAEDSIAAIAMAHGLNANLLQRWVTEYRRHGKHDMADVMDEVAEGCSVTAPANWIAVQSPAAAIPLPSARARPRSRGPRAQELVELELSGSHGVRVMVRWPAHAHEALAHFARTILR